MINLGELMQQSPSVIVAVSLPESDRDRLKRVARERGLSMSAYARQAVLERIKTDERVSLTS